MNKNPLKLTILCILIWSPSPLTAESEIAKSTQKAAHELAHACREGFLRLKNGVKEYAIPYTIAGAIQAKEFFKNYAIPYTISATKKTNTFIKNYAIPYTIIGAQHAKIIIGNYVIPAVAGASKYGYATTQKLYQNAMRAYLASKTANVESQPQPEASTTQTRTALEITSAKPSPHLPQEVIPTLSNGPDQQELRIIKQEPDDAVDCCICFESFNHNRVKVEPCGHSLFCRKCITAVRAAGRTDCPYCNQKIEQVVDAP